MTDQIAARRDLANAIRALAMDAVQQADSGHPGMPMGMADVATVLFSRYLKFDPADPKWPDRDRFVLSVRLGLTASVSDSSYASRNQRLSAASGLVPMNAYSIVSSLSKRR